MTPIPGRSGGVSDHDTSQENGWAIIDRDTQTINESIDYDSAQWLADLLVEDGRRVEIIDPDGSREMREPTNENTGRFDMP